MIKQIYYIDLKNIKLKEEIMVTETYLKRLKKNDKLLLDYDLLLAVEKLANENAYLLVGGFDRYQYLISSSKKYAPCIVEESSSTPKEQAYKIIRRIFNKGDTVKRNKKNILNRFFNEVNLSLNEITKNTGFTKGEIMTGYQYNPHIPKIFINENTTEKTLNWIQSLSCAPTVKEFLFERAGLPIGNKKRLTQDCIKIISKFLKLEPRFFDLQDEDQIKILSCAITFKGDVIDYLKLLVIQNIKS